jgi:hypothetical protein
LALVAGPLAGRPVQVVLLAGSAEVLVELRAASAAV